MFLVSFGESFVFISLLVPGTAILVAAGLLVPDGTLHLVPLLSGAILGAALGDIVSWQLGRSYGHLLEHRWPFTRHPDLIPRATRFFERYGVASVFLGRFFGPLRATIPLVAGIAKMPPVPFMLSNVGSAILWAPALLLPGSAAVIVGNQLSSKGPLAVVIGLVVLAGFAALAWLAWRHWFSARMD
jgi:membrane protein DedA with SNARE-associated domain